ncbi:MAG: DUF748 domain-containing protein [Nitrospirae bacterium]|nr:DUF748 domain-containing protein [Nitrospirota bacterium]
MISILNNIVIKNGGVDFTDGPKKTVHKITDIGLSVPFLSNVAYYADSYVTPSFEAKVNGDPLSLKGMTKPFKDSLETSFEINVKDIDVPYYLAYVPFRMDYKLVSGLFDASTVFTFIQYRDRQPTITLMGDIGLSKLAIEDLKAAPIISISAIKMSIALFDYASNNLHLKSFGLDGLDLNVVKDKSGRLNVMNLLPPASHDKKPETDDKKSVKTAGDGKPFVVDADEIRLSSGVVAFADSSVKGGFRTKIEELDVRAGHFSTGRDKKTDIVFSAKTESGEEVKVSGEMSVEPLTADGRAEAVHIPLKKYAPYYADKLLFTIEDAVLDLSVRYSFAKKEGVEDPVVRLADLAANLKNLELRKKDEKDEFLRVPEFSVSGGSVDIGQRDIAFDKISSRSAVISVKRSTDGKLNLLDLMAPQPAAPAPKAGVTKVSKAEKQWQYSIGDLRLENYALKYSDYMPSDPVELAAQRIMLTAGKISNRKGAIGAASLSLLFGKKGSISANGPFGINPLSSKMKLSVKNIELSPLQPYVTDLTNVIITDGAISAAGSVSVSGTGEGPIKAGYQGEVSVSSLRTVDSINTDELVSWNNLNINGIDAGYNPTRWHIREVALSEFYARLIINPNGRLNLQEVMKKQPAPVETPSGTAAEAATPGVVPTPAPETAAAVSQKSGIRSAGIDNITLQGGTVQFSDFYIKPNYSARIVELGGRVSGLSSEENVLGDFDLRGKVDNYAPLEITGKINPLREDLFVDLKAIVKDVDLSPVTPYSGRYAGYTIHKGKLSLDLNYHIEKKKLDADNRIFLDQFTFGDPVESPDATKLPVKLAIALLKNRKGEIRLDIPVSGYINDPHFSVGRIILKIIVNLLVKAATSPFALLGAVFGGGEELSYIDFDEGSAGLNDQALKKLATLITALNDRPSLKLDVEGHVDADKDKEGLRRLMFDRKLKAQKLKVMIKKDIPSVPVDEVKIEPAEYAEYLKMAYKDEKFPKPRNIIGIAKDLPVPEMEKLILTHIEVGENDLRQLASQRAMKVKDRIIESGQVGAERIFLVEPKSLAPEKKEGMKDSRVDFRLK